MGGRGIAAAAAFAAAGLGRPRSIVAIVAVPQSEQGSRALASPAPQVGHRKDIR
jgi:hypothetical protein